VALHTRDLSAGIIGGCCHAGVVVFLLVAVL
jgi:hypothetical protein